MEHVVVFIVEMSKHEEPDVTNLERQTQYKINQKQEKDKTWVL